MTDDAARAAPCSDEQLKVAFMKGVASVAEAQAARPAPDPAGLRELIAPTVDEWFETGYEAGHLDTGVLADRLAARLREDAGS